MTTEKNKTKKEHMKKSLLTITALVLLTGAPVLIRAEHHEGKDKTEHKEGEQKDKKAKAYPLDKCIVTDEKLDSDPAMKSYVFTHEGQGIKLCCKSCLKDFKKEPAKYLKKLEIPKAKVD